MEFEDFLSRVLPPLGLAPRPHRRRGVRRRLARRMDSLGLHEWADYAARVEADPSERAALPALVAVTISRLWRNRTFWDFLAQAVLPQLCAPGASAWSAGCASGEEPYSLAMLWAKVCPGHPLRLLATDLDPVVLARAAEGLYQAGSLRELPAELRSRHFSPERGGMRLSAEMRRLVSFSRHDLLREAPPGGGFGLVLCRNLAFTYFGQAAREAVAERLSEALRPGGWLAIGRKEHLPGAAEAAFEPGGYPGLFRKPLDKRPAETA